MEYVLSSNPWAGPGVISLEGTREQHDAIPVPVESVEDKQVRSVRQAEVIEQLRPYIGHAISLEAWDPIMLILDDEGPFAIFGRLIEFVVPEGGDPLRPLLRLEEAKSVRTRDGYDLLADLEIDGAYVLFDVGRLYRITTV